MRLTQKRLDFLTTFVRDRSYSVRLSNCLENFLFMIDVLLYSQSELRKLPNFGVVAEEELKQDFKNHGLSLRTIFSKAQMLRIRQVRFEKVLHTPCIKYWRFFDRVLERLIPKDCKDREIFKKLLVRKMCHKWAHVKGEKKRQQIIELMRFAKLEHN